jgi:hypothetical protein
MQDSQKSIDKSTGRALLFFKSLWNSPAFFSFTITVILLAIQLFFIRPFYLVNDDIFKILTVKGFAADPTPSPFVGYSNILLGYLLMKLFAWVPDFPWYGWLLCLVQFLSFWVFLWLLRLKSSRWFHLSLFTGVWAGLFFIFFTYLQFTMTALLAAFAGMMVFLMNGEGRPEPRQEGLLWASGFLVIVSALIRLDSLLVALLVALPLILFRWMEKDFRGYARRQGPYLGTVFLGVLILTAFNASWFHEDKAWAEYLRFDKARVELQDYRITQYSPQTKPYFDSVGWSENDLWLFKNWYYVNPDKFNADLFQKLGAHFSRIGSAGKTASYPSLSDLFLSNWSSRMMIGFAVLLFFCSRFSRKYLLIQWLWVALVFLALIYFYRAPERVTLPILAFLVMLSMFYAENPFENPTGGPWVSRLKVLVLLFVFALSLSSPWDYYRQNGGKRMAQDQLRDFLNQVKPNDHQLYEVWYFPFEELGAFDSLECLRPFHLFLTSFCQTSPASLRGLERFGVREPLRDAVDNPNVLFVCSTEEGLHYYQYMKETYHRTIYAVPVFKCVHFEVFSIHSRPERL